MPNGVEFEGRLAHVGTFPIGIEPDSFVQVIMAYSLLYLLLIKMRPFDSQNLQKESVKTRISQLEQRFGGVKVIVGVDRLDYIKGVPQKLHALELFLSQHPEWIGKVCLFYLSSVSSIATITSVGRTRPTGRAVASRC
jgi:trehalose 6-phosphate synthase